MASSILEPGSRVGKYEVLAHLATGGMGAVYKAVDTGLGRVVALKLLSNHLAQNKVVLERFHREAKHASKLIHPNIVTLFEFNHESAIDAYYLAMEFIDGIDLGQYVTKKGRLKPEEVRRIVLQTAKALEHAFQHGVVHRDIKPSNLMLARGDQKRSVKLTDLGLAIATDENEYRVTAEGNTVGTIDYMSPEQSRDSRSVDIRSDIYSLGCTAFHLLAGRPPFAEGGLGERLVKHLQSPPPDVRVYNPAVSLAFWAVLQKMLAKNPDDRYATPGELRRVLKAIAPQEASPEEAARGAQSGHKTAHTGSEPTRLRLPAKESDATPAPRKTRREKPSNKQTDTGAAASSATLEQTRAAAAFHERAVQVLAEGGGDSYARQLLDNCLKLDPLNITYRKTLRELNRTASSGMLARWFGSLNVIATKSKMRLARNGGDWLKVLEMGEQILAHQRSDVDAHIALAEAAENLAALPLAHWFLQQAQAEAPQAADLFRAGARFHERHDELKEAIAQWQKVKELEPSDREAHVKLNDLSAQDLLGKGRYHKQPKS